MRLVARICRRCQMPLQVLQASCSWRVVKSSGHIDSGFDPDKDSQLHGTFHETAVFLQCDEIAVKLAPVTGEYWSPMDPMSSAELRPQEATLHHLCRAKMRSVGRMLPNKAEWPPGPCNCWHFYRCSGSVTELNRLGLMC